MRESLSAGDVLDGKYEIVRELGSGAMGVIYAARHLQLGRGVAVKILRGELARDAELTARFEQEARAASAIGHPNIIEVFDLGRASDGLMYMVMELLEGRSLAELLEAQGKLTPSEAVKMIDQVLSALGAAHKNHIVHRDLKPDNIFMVESEHRAGFVKLLDFGISKILARAAEHIGEKKGTVMGTVMGTPQYMSPEQARGAVDQVDARTDLYAAGVVLYELLTGCCPFDGENYNVVMAAIIDGKYKKPRELRPGISPRLEVVIETAMAYKREDRWQTAAAFREALRQAESGAALGPPSITGGVPSLELPEVEDWANDAQAVMDRSAGAADTIRPVAPAPPLVSGFDGPPPLELEDEPPNFAPAPVAPPAAAPVAATVPQVRAATPAPQVRAVGTPAPVQRAAPRDDDRFRAPDDHAVENALLLDTEDIGSAARAPGAHATPRPYNRPINRQMVSAGRGPGRWIGLGVVLALVGAAVATYPRYKNKLPWVTAPTVAISVEVAPAGAEVRVDGEPLAAASVRVRPGKQVVEASATGYVARRVAIVAENGLEVRVRLSRQLAQLAPRDPPLPGDAAMTPGESGATPERIDAALGKIIAYRDCAERVSEDTLRWRDGFKAAQPKKGERLPPVAALDSTLHFAQEGAARCLDGVRGQAPELPALDEAVAAYAKTLFDLAQLVERTGEQMDEKKRAALWKSLGAALDQFVAIDDAMWKELIASGWRWEQAQLAAIEKQDGKTAGWHLRRFLLASITEIRQGKPAGADAAYDELVAYCLKLQCPVMQEAGRLHAEKNAEAANAMIIAFDAATTD